ncbi:hypothetical protein HU830_03250 [Lactobacillus sp. DCY120]|uniref:Polysaccharide polymerase n=1 Tax=Bombilactobacillus apium TaxID=2675299 RepID=A0A850QZS7_9LACO|nr:hypothetical protein [Bombilactobacillus apium]NVY96193.1 hypothetical protein [Bombilactobacillus apium]
MVKNKFNFGVLLLFSAVAISNLLGFIFNRDLSIIGNFLLLISLLLLVNLRGILSGRLYLRKPTLGTFWFYIAYISILSYFSIGFKKEAGALIYNLFALFLMLVLISRNHWPNKDRFVQMGFIYFGILVIITVFFLKNGLQAQASDVQTINGVYDSGGKLIADRLTLSVIPLYSFVFSIIHKSKNIRQFIFKVLCIFAALACLLIVNRRSQIVDIILVLIFSTFYSNVDASRFGIKKSSVMAFIVFVVPIGMIMAILLYFSGLLDGLGQIVDSLFKAVSTLFGSNSYGYDESGNVRYLIRKQIWGEYATYSNYQLLFGKGYMYKYLDFPILQAYVDGGLFGGIVFTVFSLVIPIRYILTRSRSRIERIFQVLLVIEIFNLFYCGIPYGINSYLVIILSIFLFKGHFKRYRRLYHRRRQRRHQSHSKLPHYRCQHHYHRHHHHH